MEKTSFTDIINSLLKMKKDDKIRLLLSLFPGDHDKSFDVLNNYREEMERVNIPYSDNYYHRLGMCENAQQGRPISTLDDGILKELYDFYRKDKSVNKKGTMGYRDALDDSFKDMKNNLEGVLLGLKNPKSECRILLEGLDWKSNTWKRK